MFYEKLLRLLSFFYIVSQIHADYILEGSPTFVAKLLFDNWGKLKGEDVTSYDEAERQQICQIGALHYQPDQQPQTASIKVKLSIPIETDVNYVTSLEWKASSSQVPKVNADITLDEAINVIKCGVFTDEDGTILEYYFGKGPKTDSIAVYTKPPNADIAEVFGMYEKRN